MRRNKILAACVDTMEYFRYGNVAVNFVGMGSDCVVGASTWTII